MSHVDLGAMSNVIENLIEILIVIEVVIETVTVRITGDVKMVTTIKWIEWKIEMLDTVREREYAIEVEIKIDIEGI